MAYLSTKTCGKNNIKNKQEHKQTIKSTAKRKNTPMTRTITVMNFVVIKIIAITTKEPVAIRIKEKECKKGKRITW